MGIVILAPTPFNMRVFKISVPITYEGKIFSLYSPCCEYYPRVSMEVGFFNIPTLGQSSPLGPSHTFMPPIYKSTLDDDALLHIYKIMYI